jgi:hypothetical protein
MITIAFEQHAQAGWKNESLSFFEDIKWAGIYIVTIVSAERFQIVDKQLNSLSASKTIATITHRPW